MLLAVLAIVGAVTSVHDGDTFRIGKTSIRLAGIDANELDGACHNSCASMGATASRDLLAGMILHRKVECRPSGTSYRRVVAWCSIDGVDLSCAQVSAGAALRWAAYDRDRRLVRCEP